MTHGYLLCTQMCGMTAEKCKAPTQTCIEKACNGNADCEEVASNVTSKGAGMAGMFSSLSTKAFQKKACDCVSKSRLKEARRTELLLFYNTWAPDQIQKVDTLAKKYANSWPMLMLSLHQKYKDSVEVTKHVEEDDKKDSKKKKEDVLSRHSDESSEEKGEEKEDDYDPNHFEL